VCVGWGEGGFSSSSFLDCYARAFEVEINPLCNVEGRGRGLMSPPACFKAVLVKMLFDVNSFSKLVQRLRNNLDLASLCGFDDPPSKMGFSRFMKRLSEAELDQRLFQEALKCARTLVSAFSAMSCAGIYCFINSPLSRLKNSLYPSSYVSSRKRRLMFGTVSKPVSEL
jgi:hypothetical protein